jgi:circadian clock protein KaiB
MKKSAHSFPPGHPPAARGKDAYARGVRKPRYLLKLYVAGSTPRSTQAIANLRSVCDDYLEGRHELEVVDIFQQPEQAVRNQIIAVPTLLKARPIPSRCLVGDLSDRARIMASLGLKEADRSVI